MTDIRATLSTSGTDLSLDVDPGNSYLLLNDRPKINGKTLEGDLSTVYVTRGNLPSMDLNDAVGSNYIGMWTLSNSSGVTYDNLPDGYQTSVYHVLEVLSAGGTTHVQRIIGTQKTFERRIASGGTVSAWRQIYPALISDISGAITGVKGNSESSYRTGNVNITKTNIGLGNVDNTSDADKPISAAVQSALDLKANIDKHVQSEYLFLNSSSTATATFDANIGVMFICRHSATASSNTACIVIVDQYMSNVTVIGDLRSNVTVTKTASSREVTITNSGTNGIGILALGGTFS